MPSVQRYQKAGKQSEKQHNKNTWSYIQNSAYDEIFRVWFYYTTIYHKQESCSEFSTAIHNPDCKCIPYKACDQFEPYCNLK